MPGDYPEYHSIEKNTVRRNCKRYLVVLICAAMLLMVAMVCLKTGIADGLPALFSGGGSQENEVHPYNFPFVSRSEWSARVPRSTIPLVVPVPYVVIHHSYLPPACSKRSQCCQAMRSMQDFHMDDHGWADIGYHFAVGGDGAAYEGRGWKTLGAHALNFNSVSIGICLIGDWRFDLPPPEQLNTAKALIKAGIELGYIKPDYKLVGHRQVRDTECPGDRLYEEIKHWKHYSSFPASAADLINVPEIPASVKALLRSNNTITP